MKRYFAIPVLALGSLFAASATSPAGGEPSRSSLKPMPRHMTGTSSEWQRNIDLNPSGDGRLSINGLVAETSAPQCMHWADRPTVPAGLKREEGEAFQVVVTLADFNPDIHASVTAMAYPSGSDGTEGSWGWPDWDDNSVIPFGLTAGVWDIYVWMRDDTFNMILLALTDVEVNGDMEIGLSIASATANLVFTSLLPDGSEPSVRTPVINPDGSSTVAEEGNSYEVLNELQVRRKGYARGFFSNTTNLTTWYDADGTFHRLGDYNLRYTPGLELSVNRHTMIFGMDGAFQIMESWEGTGNASIQNDPQFYKTLPALYASTPADLTGGDYGTPYSNPDGICQGWVKVSDGEMKAEGAVGHFGLPVHCHDISICQRPGAETFLLPVPIAPIDWNCMIFGLPYDIASDNPSWLGWNNAFPFSDLLHVPESNVFFMDRMFNPTAGFPGTANPLWGSGSPITVFATTSADWGCNYSLSFLGPQGDRRDAFEPLTWIGVSVDGGAPTEEQLENLQWGMLPSDVTMGFTVKNSNVGADDLTGTNVFTTMFDTGASDNQPPILQLLRAVDNNGSVAVRFQTPREATVEFWAGDFRYEMNYETYASWYTETEVASVSAAIAPHGTQDFLPLQPEVDDAGWFMPGFGHMYRCSLADFGTVSTTGWFDLKIRLEDASGNWQEQLVELALRIDSLAGIDGVDAETAPAEWYDLQGRRVANPSAGIYIRKCAGKASKALVR